MTSFAQQLVLLAKNHSLERLNPSSAILLQLPMPKVHFTLFTSEDAQEFKLLTKLYQK